MRGDRLAGGRSYPLSYCLVVLYLPQDSPRVFPSSHAGRISVSIGGSDGLDFNGEVQRSNLRTALEALCRYTRSVCMQCNHSGI